MRIIAMMMALLLMVACGADGEPETPPAKLKSDSPQDNAAEAMG